MVRDHVRQGHRALSAKETDRSLWASDEDA